MTVTGPARPSRRAVPDFPVVSVMGMHWFPPIALLLDALERRAPARPNEFQTTAAENGLSAAVVLLSVVLLESFLRRTQMIQRAAGFGNIESFFAELEGELRRREQKKLRAYDGRLTTRRLAPLVDEVFMLRHALAHNHLWRARVGWGEAGEFLVAPGVLDPKSGNKEFRRITGARIRESPRLRLNLSPTTVWRRDAYAVLSVVFRVLAWLHDHDARYVPLCPPQQLGSELYLTYRALQERFAERLRRLRRTRRRRVRSSTRAAL